MTSGTTKGVNSNGWSGVIDLLFDKINEKLKQDLCYQPSIAKMIAYDFKAQKADIQLLVNLQTPEGNYTENQIIADVPVVIPECNGLEIGVPFLTDKTQDIEGVVIFTKIGYDNWYAFGGQQNENLQSRGPNNCFFVPCIYSSKKANKHIDNGDDFIVNYANCEFRLKKDNRGKIVFKGVNVMKNLADQTLEIKKAFDEVVQNFTNTNTGLTYAANGLTQAQTALTTIAATPTSAPGTPPACASALKDCAQAIAIAVAGINQTITAITTFNTNIQNIEATLMSLKNTIDATYDAG